MKRPSSAAAVALLCAGSALAAGRSPEPAPAADGPSDDLVATACSQGLLVRPDGADDANGDGGAAFQEQTQQAFPGLFGGGDAAAGGAKDGGPSAAPATRSKTQLLRPSKSDKDCPGEVRGFYSKYSGQVNAIPAPARLDAPQIRADADRLYAKLDAGPAQAARLSALNGADLRQKSAAIGALFDGSRTLEQAFAQLDADAQARASSKAGRVLASAPSSDMAGAAPARDVAAPDAAAAAAAAAAAGAGGPMTASQRARYRAGSVPAAAAPPASNPSMFTPPAGASWWQTTKQRVTELPSRAGKFWNDHAPAPAQNLVSSAGSWVADKVWGGGNPAVNAEMPNDARSPARWRLVRFGRYGTAAMIGGLTQVGADLGAQGAPVLQIGDISQKGGGTFRGHLSHKIGKDVDIFFYEDKSGNFDTAWNMRLAMTAVKDLNVTHIFLDNTHSNEMSQRPLFSALTRYRNAANVSPEERALMDKALSKMSPWPGHQTHFHIRIDY
jgi:murein endopeptidase